MNKLQELKALAEASDPAHWYCQTSGRHLPAMDWVDATSPKQILKLIEVVELLYDHNEIPALKRSCDKLLEEL